MKTQYLLFVADRKRTNKNLSMCRGKETKAVHRLKRAPFHPGVVGVLFVMTLDPIQVTVPFILVSEVSTYDNEDKILFAMLVVFRTKDIEQMNGVDRVYCY